MNAQKRMEEAISKQIYDRGHDRDHPDTDNLHGNFVGAMWDPYGRVEHLPVAVVNKDVPVTYKDKELSVGEELVKNLKENNSLDFNFVDADTAAAGLANGTYYMVLTIPKDFSKNATTLTEKNAKKMMLYYETNPGQNYIASKMSETAVSKIQTNIREKITTQYTETVFEQLGTIGDGFVEAQMEHYRSQTVQTSC